MEAPFCCSANHDSALLEKVPINVRACDTSVRSKANAHELAKPTGVVISLRLSIAKRLENGVGLKNLALK
jgi:hypothetical protein